MTAEQDICGTIAGLLEDGHTPVQVAAALSTASVALLRGTGRGRDACHQMTDLALLAVERAESGGSN